MERPVFKDLKVLDFSTSLVGPSAARLLADYGATVIKMESSTHVDVLRTSPPYKDGKKGINRSGYFNNYNGGKYSFSINLKVPKALEVAKRLVQWADVVIESFRPGIMKGWGLDYEELKKTKPDLIMVSSSMLGQTGPHARFRGYGQHGAAYAGWGSTVQYPDEPVIPFGAYTDYIGARYTAMAVIGALEYRRRTGKGQYIDNSQAECSIDFLAPLVLDYSANRRLIGGMGNRDPNAAPHGAYRCKGEDRWCVIAVFTDEEWRAFCKVLGNPPWTGDPKFAILPGRKDHEDELDLQVEAWTANYPPETITEMMQKAGVPASVIQGSRDLAEDPQLAHRNHYKLLEHGEVGPHHYENFAFRLSKTPGEPRTAAPRLGEHNEYVCTRILGLSDDEFVQLLMDGVLE